jgi:NADP-dependent 3-hydroxy acid dehydrogenase YdfG
MGSARRPERRIEAACMTMTDETTLEGRTALVTGGTSGIGMAVAGALLAGGCRVLATGRRVENLDGMRASCGDRLKTVAADLSEPGAAAGILRARPAGWDIDLLICAAGHDSGGNVPFAQGNVRDMVDKLAVNFTASALLIHALLPGFLARGKGDVVAIGSIVTREAAAGLSFYGATKQALHGLLEGLRLDYRDTGLRFIELVPGVVRSGFAARRWKGDEERAERFYADFRGWLEPQDVARAVMWAVSQSPGVNVDEIVLRPTVR